MNDWIDRLGETLPELKRICPAEFLIRLETSDYNCLRFANSMGTQNTSIENLQLTVTLAGEQCEDGARLVTLSTNDFSPVDLIGRAVEALPRASLNKEFSGFCPPGKNYRFTQGWFPGTANISSIDKARFLESLRAENPDAWIGGIWESSTHSRILMGSNGLFLHEPTTEFRIEIKLEKDEQAVSVYRTGRNIAKLDLRKELMEPLERLNKRHDKVELPDGNYNCLLAPEAVSEVLFFISLLGFGGRGYKQGRNFTCGKIGDSLFDNELIVLKDDPFNPDTLTESFDDWGFPRRPLTLIDQGVVGAPAHSLFTAKSPEENTGHGRGKDPFPMLMELAAGRTGLNDLLRQADGAIRISRFHYPTIADPCKPLIKGSTKDGTYLLSDDGTLQETGRREFYFNPVALLASAVAVSRERVVVPQGSLAMHLPGANITPWLLVKDLEVRNGVLYTR